MNLILGVGIPLSYVVAWYSFARLYIRIDARDGGNDWQRDRRKLISQDFWLAAFWPFSMFLLIGPLIVDHFEKRALPKKERPLPDLRKIKRN